MEDFSHTTERLARLAGEYAQRQQATLNEWSKGGDPRNLVTNVDIEVTQLLKAEIAKEFPNDRFYSEEDTISIAGTERIWLIDPIDGTSNYARALPLYSCCVTVLEQGAVIAGSVFAPALNECFSVGSNGPTRNGENILVRPTTQLVDAYVNFHPGRRPEDRTWAGEMKKFFLERAKKSLNLGSSALDLAYLACGRFDVLVYGTLTTADIAGAIELVRRAGGEVYNFETGEPVTINTDSQRVIATASRELFDELSATMPR